MDAGKYGLRFAQRIQPGGEGFNPGEGGEQHFLVTPSFAGAAQRDCRRQRRVVVILAEAPLQQGGAVPALDIGKIFELEAFLGNVRQQVKDAGAMLLQVGGERFQPRRFATEFTLVPDAAGTPVVRREDGAVEQENALVSHQVFILVMMS